MKVAFGILLAVIAGFVDAVAYLILLHTFVAHLSGDSIELGIHLGQRQWSSDFERGMPIPCYVLGAFAGSMAAEWLARRRARSIFALPLTLEVILLALVLVLSLNFVHSDGLAFPATSSAYSLTALLAVGTSVFRPQLEIASLL